MKRFMTIGLVLAAMTCFSVTAQAGWHWGYHGHSVYYGGHGYYPHHPTVHRTYHNTNHYDYHAPQINWHGNHLHYTPGHYDFHRTGHWDTHVHH